MPIPKLQRTIQSEHLNNDFGSSCVCECATVCEPLTFEAKHREWIWHVILNEGVEGASTRSSSDFRLKCQSFTHRNDPIQSNEWVDSFAEF